MGKKNSVPTSSDFNCTEWGNRGIPVLWKAGQSKEPGHLKKLYCLHCKKETNHAEVRPYGSYNYEDFKEEFDLGRFVDGQKIPIADLMGCSKKECDYNRHGKCWNSNYSYQCSYRPLKEV